MTNDNQLSYKSFTASIEFSAEDMLLIGKVENIEGLIMFSAESPDALLKEFHEAIDSYLADCADRDIAPEKPCKGTFNVRVGSDLHRRATSVARRRGQSLNDFVKSAIGHAVANMNDIPSDMITVFEKPAKLRAQQRWSAPQSTSAGTEEFKSTFRRH